MVRLLMECCLMKTAGDRRSCIAASATMIAVVLLAFALSFLKGPASRCENAGGYMLVGPGGETSCIGSHTFVPLEGFDGSRKPN
jgi:hypothetical protein